MTRRIIAGNWKMNLGPSAARAFVQAFDLPAEGSLDTGVVLFPPSISLSAVREVLEATVGGVPDRLTVGVQNVHYEDAGAFTGEISASMAAEAGAAWVLVGHSERRHVFGETDEETRRKVDAVFRHEITPMLCVGETLEERQAGMLEETILRQLDAVMASEPARRRIRSGAPFVLAYEPVWAIGTGETATPDDASEAHLLLRERLAERFEPEVADGIPILYGGSVKPENAGDLMAAPGVDGVLVGGASLDPDAFSRIIAAAG